MRQKKDNTRQSNFELMRIISMLMIILWHILLHGNVVNNCQSDAIRMVYLFLMLICIVHVNSFVLLTGYFQSESKFKMSKLLKNINMMWFYRVIIIIIFIALNLWHPTHIEILQHSFPLDLGLYWFMDTYVILYIISPFLNKLIDSINKRQFKYMIIVLLVILSILPYLTGLKYYSNNGLTLSNFIMLYFIGAYIKRYPIENSYHFKNMSKNLFQLICIFIFLSCGIINFLLNRFGNSILSYGNIFNEIGNNLNYTSLIYSNPLVILQTTAYFCFFKTLNFKSKFINKIAGCTLAIYIIHDNVLIRKYLYTWFKISNRVIYSYKFLLYILAVVLIIYIGCTLIELLRQFIFKFIYNRKFSKKWRIKYRGYLDSLGFKINWE